MKLSERQKKLKAPDYSNSIHRKSYKPAPDLDEYLNYRRLGKFSEAYIESIGYAVTLFIQFIGNNMPLSDISGKDLDLFIKFLSDRDYKSSSIRLYISHLGGFLKYLHWSGVIASVPKKNFPIRMTEEEKLEDFQYLSSDDVIAIRQAAAKAVPTQELWRAVRDKLVIELLISTGMRKSELPTILAENIDMVSMRAKIYGRKNSHTRRSRGKSGWRMVPLTGMSVKYIKEWLVLRPENTPELLPEFSSRDTDYIVQKICVRAGLVSEGGKRSWVGPHKFRHYFATTLFKKGVGLGIIADQMGDEVKTLDSYIHAERDHDTQYIGSLME